MSDFDKEAEREKLREQFERDRQKRERSERMSELLLKGATMTNKHHDCGSPIFRWEGEEFCPACQGPNGTGGAGMDAGETPAEGEGEAPGDARTTGSAETGAVDGPPAAEEATDAASDTVDRAAEPTTDAGDASRGTEAAEIDVTAEPAVEEGGPGRTPARPSNREARSPPESGTAGGGERATAGTTGEGVAAARAALERTLADVARQAEETSTADLTHKRNLIAAAREAAEALEATRRAGRQ